MSSGGFDEREIVTDSPYGQIIVNNKSYVFLAHSPHQVVGMDIVSLYLDNMNMTRRMFVKKFGYSKSYGVRINQVIKSFIDEEKSLK